MEEKKPVEEIPVEEIPVEEIPVEEINEKPKKPKYHVKNKDLLKAIHNCKLNWCEIFDKDCTQYDVIITEKKQIFEEETIKNAKANRAKRIDVTVDNVRFYDLVFRVMTYEHIPERQKPKNKIKTTADKHVPLNFKPFKHYVIEDLQNKKIREVVRSHSKNLSFSKNHGETTNHLGSLYYTLVEEYAKQPNWSGYSYLEEMKADAIVQLISWGLKFDESQTNNPFAYMTTTIYRSFINTLKREKKESGIKENILQSIGYDETFNAQAQHDIDRYENNRLLQEEKDNNNLE